jgi:hypothetical protein
MSYKEEEEKKKKKKKKKKKEEEEKDVFDTGKTRAATANIPVLFNTHHLH